MKTVLALGANSSIVNETLKCFAKDGDCLLLVARDQGQLDKLSLDLKVRGASQVYTFCTDLASMHSSRILFEQIPDELKKQIDTVYIGYGSLPDNHAVLLDESMRAQSLSVNFLSVVEHCLQWFNYFSEHNKSATIAVISSVAGLRGRRTNIVYGAAKGGLNTFLSGLRSLGTTKSINVITILPGFVDTPMTAHLKKGALFASSEYVGQKIHSAITNKKDVCFVPWFWQWIMLIIRILPEKLFKKLSF